MSSIDFKSRQWWASKGIKYTLTVWYGKKYTGIMDFVFFWYCYAYGEMDDCPNVSEMNTIR